MRLQLMVYQFYLPHQIRDWISIYKLNMNLLALVSKVSFFFLLKRGILRIKTFSVCLKRKQKENL